jgi:hypothetical protein
VANLLGRSHLQRVRVSFVLEKEHVIVMGKRKEGCGDSLAQRFGQDPCLAVSFLLLRLRLLVSSLQNWLYLRLRSWWGNWWGN